MGISDSAVFTVSKLLLRLNGADRRVDLQINRHHGATREKTYIFCCVFVMLLKSGELKL